MNARKTLLFIVLFVLFGTSYTGRANAQKQDPRWYGPFRLSTPGRYVIGYLDAAVTVADSYGFVHALWLEGGVDDNRYVIQYARFDGVNWTSPVDIYLSQPGDAYGFLSRPVVTQDGILHVLFTKSQFGSLLHLSVPADQTLSAQNWTTYPVMREPYYRVSLAEGPDGTLHMVGASLFGSAPGVYYQTSIDGGRTWSAQKWLDPDLPTGTGATAAVLQVDPVTGILHVAYRYETLSPDGTSIGQGHYYIRSVDGGTTWSKAVTLDTADEDPAELRADDLSMAAYGGQVHVLWPGNVETNRTHAYSLDSGETWIGPGRVFGSLRGSAGDDLVVDAAGNFHFFTQLRYPQALYEAVWDGVRWDIPALIYLISESPDDPIGDRIHVHNIQVAVRRGNQLVVIFTDPPADTDRAVYAMHRELPEIQPEAIVPTPLPTAVPTRIPPTELPSAGSTPGATPIPYSTLPPEDPGTPGATLAVSIVIVLAFLAGMVVVRWRNGVRR